MDNGEYNGTFKFTEKTFQSQEHLLQHTKTIAHLTNKISRH